MMHVDVHAPAIQTDSAKLWELLALGRGEDRVVELRGRHALDRKIYRASPQVLTVGLAADRSVVLRTPRAAVHIHWLAEDSPDFFSQCKQPRRVNVLPATRAFELVAAEMSAQVTHSDHLHKNRPRRVTALGPEV